MYTIHFSILFDRLLEREVGQAGREDGHEVTGQAGGAVWRAAAAARTAPRHRARQGDLRAGGGGRRGVTHPAPPSPRLATSPTCLATLLIVVLLAVTHVVNQLGLAWEPLLTLGAPVPIETELIQYLCQQSRIHKF